MKKVIPFLITFISLVHITTTPLNALGSFGEIADQINEEIGLDQNLWGSNDPVVGLFRILLPLIMVIAGIILFIMIIGGGYQMLVSASDPKGAEAGKQRISSALIGFLVIFASYWIVQIIEIIFGVNIFSQPQPSPSDFYILPII